MDLKADPVRPVAPLLEAFLDSERFYELMQAYRHAPDYEQRAVLEAFELVKSEIVLAHLAAAPVPCAASPVDPIRQVIDKWNRPVDRAAFGSELSAAIYDEARGDCVLDLQTALRATGEGVRDEPPPNELVDAMCGPAPAVDQPTDRDLETAPVAVSLDPHRRLVADLLDPLLAQVDDCALWKVLNEADEHKASWSVDAWRQWFVQLVDAASELSCRLEDPDFVARLRGEATVRHEYLSTACQHQLHDRCRQTCKFCAVPCRCACHGASLEDQPR